tara:strand:- start:341 stop:691 length:351 start_codon:yes stop_codon:yes gene_type:complete
MNLPVFVENSRIPMFLSRFSPIEINAITLGPIILCREKISKATRQHEAIHWEQYKECLILGFLILYLAFYIINLAKGMNGPDAYHNIPFEKEAYKNQSVAEYLINRQHFAWMRNLK